MTAKLPETTREIILEIRKDVNTLRLAFARVDALERENDALRRIIAQMTVTAAKSNGS